MATVDTPAPEHAPDRTPDRALVGVGWMLLSTLLFVGVTGIVRYLGAAIPAPEAAFIRYAVGLLLVLPALRPVLRHWPRGRLLGRFALRGLVHGIGVTLWFYAMARIPIAEVTALGYTAPIFVTLGAAFFFGEKLYVRRILAVVAAFAGAMVILRPGFHEISSGQIAQLIAAPMFAASYLLAKGLTRDQGSALIVGMLSLGCTITLLPGALLQWRQPTLEEVGWLSLTAAVATTGHYCLTRAIQAAPLTVTQPVGFLQLVWATILGVAAFGEPVDPYVLLGGGIVVAAITYISHREAAAARRLRTPPAVATKS